MSARLTELELRILSYVSHGFSNRRIAAELGIKEITARNRVSQITLKLEASDRAHAVRIGFEDGLLERSQLRAPRVVTQRGIHA